MKKRIIFLAFLPFLFFSCQKSSPELVTTDPPSKNLSYQECDGCEVNFMIDENKVSFNPLDMNDDNTFVIITMGDDGKALIQRFTTKAKYIKWGKENNFPVEKSLIIEEHLRQYAEENGIIEAFENSGKIPASYTKYESQYLRDVATSAVNKRWVSMLYEHCPTGGSAAAMGVTLPAMWPGWNNRVSRYDPINIWGGMSIYDKTFYRKKMATIWGWGFNSITFCPNSPYHNLNDRMSSGINWL